MAYYVSSITPMKKHISKEDVRKAAEVVRKSGKPVTIQNIRAVLGRGSYTTLVKYQQQLMTEQEEMDRLADPLEPSPEVKNTASELTDRLARHAFEAGVTRGLTQTSALRDRVLALELERDGLIADLDTATEESRLAKAEAVSLRESWQSEVREERRRVDSTRAELEALRMKRGTLEKSSAERLEKAQQALHTALIDSARKDVLLAKMEGQLLAVTTRVEN